MGVTADKTAMMDVNGNPKVTTSAGSGCSFSGGGTPNCGITLLNRTYTNPNTGLADPQFKAMAFGSVGPTAPSVGATAASTFTWNQAFLNANYSVVCTPTGPQTGIPVLSISAKTARTVTVQITAASAAAASTAGVHCMAKHDTTPQY